MSSGQAQPLEPEAFERILGSEAVAFGLSLSPGSLSNIARYLSELDRWRRRVNLTGALTVEELVSHALESAFGERLIAHGARVIDIGSGAGFPGFPIALVRGDVSMTLLEPRAKRSAFLRHVVRELGLSNVSIREARIDDVGGQTFEAATTRAVGNLAVLVGSGAFLELGGIFLAWTTEPEASLKLRNFRRETVVPIPGSARRAIVAFRKLA